MSFATVVVIAGGAAILICIPLVAVCFAMAHVAMTRAKRTMAASEVKVVELAIESYVIEYGKLPDVLGAPSFSDATITLDSPEGTALLTILEGKESGPVKQNPRGVVFLTLSSVVHGPKPGGLPVKLLDPFKHPYRVVFDYDWNRSIVPPAGSGGVSPVTGYRALVYSLGPAGKGGGDVIPSW